MSDESDASTSGDDLRESLGETLEEAVDEAASETAGAVEEMGRQLGSRIGREAGGVIGRELGGVVAVDLREGVSLRSMLADVKDRSLELLAALLRNVDVEPIVAWLVNRGKSLVAGQSAESLVDAAGSVGDRVAEVAETDEEADAEATDDAAESTGTDDAEATTESDEDGLDPSALSAEDLQALRSETYRELLEKMSYRELQSIAKEAGVKANLSQDEMTDRIVETFSEESDA